VSPRGRGRAPALALVTGLALAAVLSLNVGCSRLEASSDRVGAGRARVVREQGGPSGDTTAALRVSRSAASGAPGASANAEASTASAANAEAAAEGAAVRVLRDARLVALTPARAAEAPEATFTATLVGEGAAPPRAAALSLATDVAPDGARRPLAFYRLAAALGMHVVPAAVSRSVSVGELGALLEGQPTLLAMIRREARVQNDGGVDALLTAPLPASLPCLWGAARTAPIELRASAEARLWERWASSPLTAPDERARLLRDFVETLVLDYLAAVEVRGEALYLPDEGALALTDNRGAFPLRPDADLVAALLRRLRGVARFPRGLRVALARLDRARAAEALAPGGFDTWLVPPRSLLELDERRASLLSLIEARVAEHGEARVLCL